ncbi:MAG: hypothetical protein GXO92_05210 [FCB group bacterium]|nr:hypothetical protein [FCB group bacterium]
MHRPNVPYFLEAIQFQTMEMNIFPKSISGMVNDRYTDLQWNPANILQYPGNAVYFDFNPLAGGVNYAQPITYRNKNKYTSDMMVIPRWYPRSSVNSLQTTPLYNFAALLTVGPRLSIGFINRSLFDYGPFRSSYSSYPEMFSFRLEDLSLDASASPAEPKRMEVDENQQTVMGTQSELILGYKLSGKIDLGLRLGHYIFTRGGDFHDSKWNINPHSSKADLSDENLEIDGNQLEVGVGLVYKPGDKTRLGIYAGLNRGNGTEKTTALDTSDRWLERDSEPEYYSIGKYTLDRKESYSSKGKKPNVTITFERKLSHNLLIRSFAYGSTSTIDISGSSSSTDTVYSDRTYDVWDYDSQEYYFQRKESHGSRESGLEGSGKEKTSHWRWFVSLIYAPEGSWSAFGGIQVQKYTVNRKSDEASDYFYHDWSNYTGFETRNFRDYNKRVKNYTTESNFEEWSVILPLGIKAEIAPRFHVILGTDVTLTLRDQYAEGKLLYAEKISRRWEDGSLVVNDEEFNRSEEFSSNPEKVFNRAIGQRFGITYDHPSGARLFIRSGGDIFNTGNWGLGFEMNF